ncbi:TauD/TfdA family dioxygenase [Sansalvadorimonas verongulae]|uniref:TauD/TfdA family dioxygenase n=1 Tax=Sansalvadorimonas verongulae TaxID=2172824 RepID=UPI0012BC8F16|nr:TauD/TfdA family dioxygenase [Sansalvadorimonas verongulae]MTI12965.1 hypothetical protein [Sansalvadorimonas verongulae]
MSYKALPKSVQLNFSKSEAENLLLLSANLAQHDFSSPYLYDHNAVGNAAEKLSGPTFDALRNFASGSNRFGTLLLKGLPIDSALPETPKFGGRPSSKVPVSEVSVAILGCLVGDIYSYGDEKEGLLIQNICPVKGMEHRQENTGSSFLEFHTEDSFHPIPPDFILLNCLRGDRKKQAITATASIYNVLETLDDKTISQLTQPNFIIRSSSSFGESSYTKCVQILSFEGNKVHMVFDPSAMIATDGSSAAAMKCLHKVLKKETYGACLEPGHALLIDNTKACHARTHFEPFYDGHDRWLQRVFLSRSINSFTSYMTPNTRMIDPLKVRSLCA